MLSAANIVKNHPSEPIMIFSETIDSIMKLEKTLESYGISSRSIHNKIPVTQRKKILEDWGKETFRCYLFIRLRLDMTYLMSE